MRVGVLFSVFCFPRTLEADVRLLGILNEQYEDRDTLISEISKEVR